MHISVTVFLHIRRRDLVPSMHGQLPLIAPQANLVSRFFFLGGDCAVISLDEDHFLVPLKNPGIAASEQFASLSNII